MLAQDAPLRQPCVTPTNATASSTQEASVRGADWALKTTEKKGQRVLLGACQGIMGATQEARKQDAEYITARQEATSLPLSP